MAKLGQAAILTTEQQCLLFEVLKLHHHPEKNTAIMQICFKLGLKAREIALLRIKEIAKINPTGTSFQLLDVMSIPTYRDADRRPKSYYQRRIVSFGINNFNKLVRQIEVLAKAGEQINPESFYPPIKQYNRKSRDLPLVDEDLRKSLIDHLALRIGKCSPLKPSDNLFINQKKRPYSPNSLQNHMALMLRTWAGIENGSSHSGRRSVIINVVNKQKKSIRIAQEIAGHVNLSSTLRYEEKTEVDIEEALKNLD